MLVELTHPDSGSLLWNINKKKKPPTKASSKLLYSDRKGPWGLSPWKHDADDDDDDDAYLFGLRITLLQINIYCKGKNKGKVAPVLN
jgi:hypothetical protein